MKQYIILILSCICLIGCFNESMEKQDNFLCHDVRIYRNSPAWKLAKAVKKGNVVKIKQLCENDTSLLTFQETTCGQTLLVWAAYTGRFNSVKALLEAGGDPNKQSYDGTSAFILGASKSQSVKYIRLMLKHGGDVNAIAHPNDSGVQHLKTPLIAASRINLESVKILVEAGADINYRSEHQQSALRKACLSYNIEIVQYLLAQGAEFKEPLMVYADGTERYITDLMRNMCFELGSEKHKTKMEVAEFLKEHGMDYRKSKIPKRYYDMFSKEYLEKY